MSMLPIYKKDEWPEFYCWSHQIGWIIGFQMHLINIGIIYLQTEQYITWSHVQQASPDPHARSNPLFGASTIQQHHNGGEREHVCSDSSEHYWFVMLCYYTIYTSYTGSLGTESSVARQTRLLRQYEITIEVHLILQFAIVHDNSAGAPVFCMHADAKIVYVVSHAASTYWPEHRKMQKQIWKAPISSKWRGTKGNANSASAVFFHLREIKDLQHVGSSPESSQIFSTEYTRVPNPTLWTHTWINEQ